VVHGTGLEPIPADPKMPSRSMRRDNRPHQRIVATPQAILDKTCSPTKFDQLPSVSGAQENRAKFAKPAFRFKIEENEK
jgi:hypothetical protein